MISGEINYMYRSPDEIRAAIQRTLDDLQLPSTWTGDHVEVARGWKGRSETSTINISGTTVRLESRLENSYLDKKAMVDFFNRLTFLLEGGNPKRWQVRLGGAILWKAPLAMGLAILASGGAYFVRDEGKDGTWDPRTGDFHMERARGGCIGSLLIVGFLSVIPLLLIVYWRMNAFPQ
jgi:hypothetical protein